MCIEDDIVSEEMSDVIFKRESNDAEQVGDDESDDENSGSKHVS